MNAGIGFITPPLGLNLFVISGITGQPVLSIADTTGISRFVLDGFSSFDNLGAGGIISGLDIGFDTFDLGLDTLHEIVLLAGFGFHASGFQQRFEISLGIHAQILERDAASVNEAPAVLLLLAGLLGLLGGRWRQGSRA